MRSFLILLAAALLPTSAKSETLAEREVLSALPIRDMTVSDQTLHYSYLLPCHAQELGLLVQPSNEQQTELKLIVIAKHRGIGCAGMPKLVYRQTDLIRIGHIKKLVKMNPSRIEGRLQLGKVASLKQIGPERQIEAIWQKRCTRWEGFVLGERRVNHAPLGFLESLQAGGEGPCATGEDVHRPKFLTTNSALTYTPIVERRALDEAFQLHLVPVVDQSVVYLNKSKKLQLSYVKRCNEAPVGVVVGRQRQKGVMHIGMLAAHYYNRPCDKTEQKRVRLTYEVTFPSLRTGITIATLKPTKRFGAFTVRTPIAMGYEENVFQTRYLGSCGRQVGMIYSQNGASRVLAGILERPSFNSECKNPTKKLSFEQPYFRSDFRRQFYPLNVRGETIL